MTQFAGLLRQTHTIYLFLLSTETFHRCSQHSVVHYSTSLPHFGADEPCPYPLAWVIQLKAQRPELALDETPSAALVQVRGSPKPMYAMSIEFQVRAMGQSRNIKTAYCTSRRSARWILPSGLPSSECIGTTQFLAKIPRPTGIEAIHT